MDPQALNMYLFKKIALAVVLIRNTPNGIKPCDFTRALAEQLTNSKKVSLNEEFDNLNEQQLLLKQYLLKESYGYFNGKHLLSTSLSSMELEQQQQQQDDIIRKHHNEYEYGDFIQKILFLKSTTTDDTSNTIDDSINFVLNIMINWLEKHDYNSQSLPVDCYLYAIRVVTEVIEFDKFYFIRDKIFLAIEQFAQKLLNILSQFINLALDVYCIKQMLITLGLCNSCVVLTLKHLCERVKMGCNQDDSPANDDYSQDYETNDFINEMLDVVNEIVHFRSVFYRNITYIGLELLNNTLKQILTTKHGKKYSKKIYKIDGRLQAVQATIMGINSQSSDHNSQHSEIFSQKSLCLF